MLVEVATRQDLEAMCDELERQQFAAEVAVQQHLAETDTTELQTRVVQLADGQFSEPHAHKEHEEREPQQAAELEKAHDLCKDGSVTLVVVRNTKESIYFLLEEERKRMTPARGPQTATELKET